MALKYGVIGSGSFGITVAKLLSHNVDVLVYCRRTEIADKINKDHFILNTQLDPRIKATTDLEEVCKTCTVLFPVIPSSAFCEMMQKMSFFLHPYHIIIHGTKGLDVSLISSSDFEASNFYKHQVRTMSEVIVQETSVVRVGCISGPNLSKEILKGLPAACVIASDFDEVIKIGQEALSSRSFSVFESKDLKGAEIAGAFKNIIAVASGLLAGLEMGKNIEALLITRGLNEMIGFGIAVGLSGEAFLGTAGVGDLIATATSNKSRNYTFGYRFARGESFDEIISTSDEVIEGVSTLRVIYQLGKHEKILLPITYLLHKVIFEGTDLRKGIEFLMGSQYNTDVDFMIQVEGDPD